jgi:hypothetical protein
MQLVACGIDDAGISGGSSSGSSKSGSEVATVQRAGESLQEISGSVGDGPITGATITVLDTNGEILAIAFSDDTATYNSAVQAEPDDYPLILEVSGGIDLVTGTEPDFQMVSVVMSAADDQVNINPFTTIIVKAAQSMPGGVTQENIQLARAFIANDLEFGLDYDAVPDPVTTIITDDNIAHIVKASETLGEMIRRVRDASAAAGEVLSGDDVVDIISADMVDGFLDGIGAHDTYAEIATLVRVVSAQVLVESLGNQLKVNGVVASGAMDNAIQISHPYVDGSALTGSVGVTPYLLAQTKALLEETRNMQAITEVDQLLDAVAAITMEMTAEDIAMILPVNAGAALEPGIQQAAANMVQARLRVNPIGVRKIVAP